MSTASSSNDIPARQVSLCTEQHALYCFEVLSAHFEGREPAEPEFGDADERYALFVTWNITPQKPVNLKKNATERPRLRGCIGNFSPMSLGKGLKEYALVSALQDHRFSPIQESELSRLSCSVSLLTPFTPIPDPLSWTPGTHGIHITFPDPSSSSTSQRHKQRTLSATYLPEIASEQGWSREETILSAIQKAGYDKKVSVGDEIWRSLQVKVYRSSKAAVGWGRYQEWKSKGGE